MVGHDGLAACRIDLGGELVTEADLALFQPTDVRVGGAALLSVGHYESRADIAELAGVTHLATGLGIERRAIEEHFALVSRRERLYRDTTLEQRHDLADVGDAFVSQELGLAFDLHTRAQSQAELAGGLRLLALLLHGCFVAGAVDGQPALARDVIGEVDREADRCRRA